MQSRPFLAIDDELIRKAGLGGAWRFFSERFTPAGRWFLLATCVWFLAGVNSLDLQAYVPLLYAFVFWFLAALALPLVRPRLQLKTEHEERISAGEVLPVRLEIAGRHGRADEYRLLPWRAPKSMEVIPAEGLALPAPEKGAALRLETGLLCKKRGVYRLPGWRIETDFPFGLLRAHQTFAKETPLLIYPRFTPLSFLDVPLGRRFHPGGVALASRGGDSFEFLGNRDYREGDALRDIDWRATARLQKPIIREYREEYFLRVAVVLDTHLPKTADDADDDAFEKAVSLCASIGDYIARQDYIVDILAAGPNLYHLTAGRGLAYLDQILDILACVEGNPEEPFEVLEPEIGENLSKINTIICIFLDWTESRRTFLERLERSGAGLKAIIVRDEPCTLEPAGDAHFAPSITVLSRRDCENADLRL